MIARPGDIIRTIKGETIDSLDELNALLGSADTRIWEIGLDLNGRRFTGTVRL